MDRLPVVSVSSQLFLESKDAAAECKDTTNREANNGRDQVSESGTAKDNPSKDLDEIGRRQCK